MTIWYLRRFGEGRQPPGGDDLHALLRLELQAEHAGLPHHGVDRGAVVLEREIGVAGGVRAAIARDFAAHPHVAELVLDRPLDREWRARKPRIRGRCWRARPCPLLRFVARWVKGAAREGSMRVLVIGAGGREHALAWKLSQSPQAQRAVRRAGQWRHRARSPTNLACDITDNAAVVALASEHQIDFVVVGPDAQVVQGLGDDVRAAGHRLLLPEPGGGPARGLARASPRRCATRWASPPPPIASSTLLHPALDYVRAHSAADRDQGRRSGARQGRDGGDDARRGRCTPSPTASAARSARRAPRS